MGHALILAVLLKFFVVAGFAYIIWTLALKESAPLKIIGQTLAVAILILVLIATVLPGRTHRQSKRHLKGRPAMTEQKGNGSAEAIRKTGERGRRQYNRHGKVKMIDTR
jgi:hypothetical protein